MRTRIVRLVLVALAAGFGALVGLPFGAFSFHGEYPPSVTEYDPLPHHVPKSPGGLSLRFAMVHDVIHERFPKHGPAHYRERNRITQAKLAALKPDDPASFPLADDLGAGLERLGQSREAVRVLRDKLARQEKQGIQGRALYTSYANLGTFLIHANFAQATRGDILAQARMREGLGFVKKAVEVNPEAHFGREQWQAVAAEFLLAAMTKPELLETYDLIGNRLDCPANDVSFDRNLWLSADEPTGEYGRAYNWHPQLLAFDDELSKTYRDSIAAEPPVGDEPAAGAWWERVKVYRLYITRVGAEKGWREETNSSQSSRVPFDEPVLGIIGMWRQGGGANPHFALCLGEVMLRVGQRYIAWTAYERAARMAERFWPDAASQRFLREHCAKRQREIEATLTATEVAELRPRFEEELAYGERYQREYQEYEARKIAEGVPIADEHFFDEFHRTHEPIASRPGPEEWYATATLYRRFVYDKQRKTANAVFDAGLAAVGMAGLIWLVARVRSSRSPRAEGAA